MARVIYVEILAALISTAPNKHTNIQITYHDTSSILLTGATMNELIYLEASSCWTEREWEDSLLLPISEY
jgi:hypothetical protein